MKNKLFFIHSLSLAIYLISVIFLNPVQGSPVSLNIWEDVQQMVGTAENTFETGIVTNSTNVVDKNEWIREKRVLNYFPVPVEEECNANDNRRRGICMNTQECHMQGGTSKGSCALGFGVCCVFTATCEEDIYNNITYFVNPDFPDLTRSLPSCALKIKKIEPDIVQIRLDFLHFNLGQPNRRTGVCDEDIFTINGGVHKELILCGVNSGQHVYLDLDESDEPILIRMNMSRKFVSRLWEIRITQLPFAHRAPAECLQYYTGHSGVIQTMNFAENGRHLANQDYTICMRQEEGMCSIAYEPCDDNSFKISGKPINSLNFTTSHTVSPYPFPITTAANRNASVSTATSTVSVENATVSSSSPQQEPDDFLNDVGSGDGSQNINLNTRSRSSIIEDDELSCTDRILLPCDNEGFLMPSGARGGSQQGNCNLVHCGSTLCPSGESPCRVESDVVPFTVGVQFVDPSGREESPDDNIGMCLNYKQQPCL